ncbi:hypothetical protein N7490_001443, partial [Penicillium lividum]
MLYRPHNHWKSSFLTTAEVSRVAEDFGRFQLSVRLFERPLFGCKHDSFLINGAVESSITLNTDFLAEDFWFGLHAARCGFKFGWIHAVAREQAPVNRDYVYTELGFEVGAHDFNAGIFGLCES